MSDEQRAMSLEEAISILQSAGLFVKRYDGGEGYASLAGGIPVEDEKLLKAGFLFKQHFIIAKDDDNDTWEISIVVGQRSIFLKIDPELKSIIDATVNYYTLEQATSSEDNRVNVALFDLQDSGLITEIFSKTCIKAYSTTLLQENVLWSFEEQSYEFMLNASKFKDDKFTFTLEITDSGWQVTVEGSENYQEVLTFPTLKETVEKVIAIRKELYS